MRVFKCATAPERDSKAWPGHHCAASTTAKERAKRFVTEVARPSIDLLPRGLMQAHGWLRAASNRTLSKSIILSAHRAFRKFNKNSNGEKGQVEFRNAMGGTKLQGVLRKDKECAARSMRDPHAMI